MLLCHSPGTNEGNTWKFSLEDKALTQQLLEPAESQCGVCSDGWENPWGSTPKVSTLGTEEMQEIFIEVENWQTENFEENQMTAM